MKKLILPVTFFPIFVIINIWLVCSAPFWSQIAQKKVSTGSLFVFLLFWSIFFLLHSLTLFVCNCYILSCLASSVSIWLMSCFTFAILIHLLLFPWVLLDFPRNFIISNVMSFNPATFPIFIWLVYSLQITWLICFVPCILLLCPTSIILCSIFFFYIFFICNRFSFPALHIHYCVKFFILSYKLFRRTAIRKSQHITCMRWSCTLDVRKIIVTSKFIFKN